MNNNSVNVFDSSAGVYDEMIKKGMVLPGSDHAYFEQYKMHYLRPYLTQCRKLLDYGCGIGRFSQVVQECYPQMVIHGYDVSKESIAVVSPELLHGENKFVSTRDELDFDYDVVLLITVLHHVALDERLDVIRDAVSRLKPGGVLIVIEHNMRNFLTKRSVDACPLDDSALMLRFEESHKLISSVCPNVSSRYIVFWPKQLRFMRFMDGLLSKVPFGAQYMIVAKKASPVRG